MYRYDYYSGAVTPNPSGFGMTTNMSNIMTSNSPQSQYVLDPNARYQQLSQSQNIITPGFTGYNQGNGYIPTTAFQTPNGYTGFAGNPALSMIGNQQFGMYPWQQNQIQYADKVVHVPGFSPGSEALFSKDIEEECTKLQMEMMLEQEEAIEERNQRMKGYFNNNYGANYYGMPYYGSQFDDNVTQKYRKRAEEIRQQAVNKRLNFNKNLSKLSHGFIGDELSDEEIDRIYEGYSYTIPSAQVQQDVMQTQLQNMRPVSNQSMYIQHHNQVKANINNLIGSATNMNEFLDKQGLLIIEDNLEKEMHTRRDGTQYYQQDAYRAYLRKQIRERIARENGTLGGPINNPAQPYFNSMPSFSTLQQCSNVLDDGTLSIHIPSGRLAVENNIMEQKFEENRSRFLASIWAQDNGGSN